MACAQATLGPAVELISLERPEMPRPGRDAAAEPLVRGSNSVLLFERMHVNLRSCQELFEPDSDSNEYLVVTFGFDASVVLSSGQTVLIFSEFPFNRMRLMQPRTSPLNCAKR